MSSCTSMEICIKNKTAHHQQDKDNGMREGSVRNSHLLKNMNRKSLFQKKFTFILRIFVLIHVVGVRCVASP